MANTAYIPPIQTDCCCDLSHSNNIPNPVVAFKAAMNDPHPIALILQKATQGTSFVDPTFKARRDAAKQVGVMFGAYHFCDGSDPVSQANFFLNTVGIPDITLALDAEKNASQITIPQLITLTQTIVKSIGRKLDWLYMGRSGPDGNGTGMTTQAMTTLAGLVKWLWLPEYGSNPICPLGFSTWELHQYTGDGINGTGSVAGIGTGLDRSYFAGTIPQMKAAIAAVLGQPMPVPSPTPSPTPTLTNPMPKLSAAQTFLGETPDGQWGPDSDAAFAKYYQQNPG